MWDIYAYIVDDTVIELAVFSKGLGATIAPLMARENFNAVAVDVTQFPVAIGDSYVDGVFSRMVDGERIVIERVPTIEEQTAENTSDIGSHDRAIDDIWVALLEV